MLSNRALTGLLLICLTAVLCGCSPSDAPSGSPTPKSTPVAQTDAQLPEKPRFKNYQEKGDLEAIRVRKTLRILSPRWEDTGLPRAGLPSHGYRDLAESFAAKLNVQLEWILVDTHTELIDQLEQGYGDLITAHLTQTSSREKRIAFSLPLSRAEELIVGPQGTDYSDATSLRGKRIAVGEGSSFVQSLKVFTEQYPDLHIQVVELKTGDPDTLIDLLNSGQFDATVMDHNVAESLMAYRQDFSIGLTLTEQRPIAWAVRKGASQLLVRLNRFLTEAQITQHRSETYTDDLAQIKERKTLRMITRNSPMSYFLWRGELMGYEYDLVKKFADRQGLRLEVKVAPPGVDMIALLKSGEGDLIAANTTITPEREARGIKFTRHYDLIQEQLVTHKGASALQSLESLNGRTLHIKKSHAYWETAQKLLKANYDFTLVAVDEAQTSSDILAAIARGEMDATIADSHLIAVEYKFNKNLQPGLKLEGKHSLGWAVRENNPELLAALNQYIKKHYRGQFFNVIYNKYFRNEKRIDKYQGQRLTDSAQLSPYDEIVKPLADQYHFDWRLLVSQMYQESKFNPKAKSFAGARGLFQVMPRTAKELGVALPFTPQTGIEAGVRYMDWTRDRFEHTLPLEERLWFALAAYNAGFGHVNDARRLARQQGWSGDKWFDNVEKAMLLLKKREYHSKARFGYVRGTEPVNYVRQIRQRYTAYLEL